MLPGVPFRPAENGVVLAVADVIRTLEVFLEGRASAAEVHNWAESYDANEEVEVEVDALLRVVFELTSPEINGELTVARAARIREELLRLGV